MVETVTIYDWMIKRLGLKPNELLVYAFIYGHKDHMGEKHQFSGGISAIADSLMMNPNTLGNIISNLRKWGFIDRVESVYDARIFTFKINMEAIKGVAV